MKVAVVKTEADLNKHVIRIAHDYGWKVAFFHRLPTPQSKQWRTPVGADGKGWPDLVLVRERLIFAELKVHYRKPSAEQQRWLDSLRDAGQEVYVWTEKELELGTIETTLRQAMTPLQIARLTVASNGDTEHARRVSLGVHRQGI